MPDSSPLSPLQQAVIALRSQRARIAELEQAGSAPIAVVGMACRYPAGAESPEALWQAVSGGRDGSREVPKDRWDIDAFYDPTPGRAGKMYVRNSCFIDRVDGFEPLFFRISPREAVGIDPQQRLLLEVTWEALEDAAIPPPSLVGSQTGVFIGISTNDYSALLSRTVHGSGSNASAGAGNAASVASGRLSYTFGFQGPCMAVDTACSSSLVATHLAVQALRNRECGLAVVAGVNLMLTPDITVNFCLGRMLSPDGHCKTFDESADGYVRGEGCGVVILKRLSDAVNDGDRVLAVIRGSALGQDGRSAGLTAPNGLAQEQVIRKALANAGLAPDAIDYIEAHGTGTALGDPIEMHALKSVFAKRDRPLHVGSVKTNIGHTEAAAGVAGLIKAVAMLRNQALPPTLHFKKLNPHIDLGDVDIRVPTELTDADIRAVGVSSFGFSGTNAHIVLERAEPATPAPAQVGPAKLVISARTEQGLRALIQSYRDHLAGTTDNFGDIAHTAAIGRARLPWWVAVDSAEALATAVPTNSPLPKLPPTSGRKVRLPATPFQRERFWIDGAVEASSAAVAVEVDERLPPLLGRKLSLPFSTESRWEAAVSTRHPALGFLAEHQVNGSVVLPASAYVEMILAALPGLSIAELEITAPLVLSDEPRLLQTIVGADNRFRIASCAADADPQLHASGRTQPRTAPPLPTQPLAVGTPLPADDLYGAMARRGVVHGPAFRLLDAVRRVEGTAVATLREAADESRFSIHPARLDAVLQLVAAALPDTGAEVMVPAGVGRLSLFRRPAPDAVVQALARREAGEVLADITVSDKDGVALAIEQLRFRPAPLPASERGFYRIDWRAEPLLSNLAPPAFLPATAALAARLNEAGQRLAVEHGTAAYDAIGDRLEEAATGYIVKALRTLGLPLQAGAEFTFSATAEALGIAERHHRLLRRVLRLLADDGVLKQAGRRFWVKQTAAEVNPDAMLDVLVAEAPAMQGEIGVLRRCGGALAEVLTGRRDPLSLLFPAQGDGAGAFYETSPYARTVNGLLRDVAKALAGSLPRGRTLRVLEVGAGTGGATGAVLEGLAPTRPHYVFTDLSASFLTAARQKFGGADLKTQILDVERPTADQGIAAQGFDVVLAANVLHATRDLRQTLAHVRETLAPGGVLLLVESTAARRWVDIVFGLTEGWWRFSDRELRPDHPLLSREAWSRLLQESGFDTADTVGEVIVARRNDAAAASGLPARVHVVPPAAATEDAQVALLGELIDVAQETAAAAKRLVLVGDGRPGHDGLPGFVRTLQLEMPALQPRLLQAPPSDIAAIDEIVAGESDSEVRWNADGRREVPRLVQAGVGAAPDRIDGTWLVTGARGGVAQAIAGWLAGRGASALVLVSRQKPEPPVGVTVPVHCHAGDAADADFIAGLLHQHQVQGVVHAAGQLADAGIAEQTEETIRAVARGKLGGALALDRATRAHPVKHFVLCSSVAGVVGSARQVNHAFCAAFLDGIAQRRQADGLPALSIDWGVWNGTGSAAALGFDQMAEQLGLGSIAPAQGTALFGRALSDPRAQLVALPSVDWPRFASHFGGKPPALLRDVSTVARPVEQRTAPGAQPVAPDRHAGLARIIAACLGISGTVDPATPFHDLGLDSLIAVEIRNRVENELGLAVSVRELIEGASLSTLAARLGDAPAPTVAPAEDGRIAAIVAAVLGLSGAPDETIPLHDLGLDSLMAVEIRNRLENEAGIIVSVRELIEGASIQSLKQSTGSAGTPSTPAPAARPAYRRQAAADLAHRHDPFPLTDMQQAYWLGRRNDVAMGSISCYLYTEYDTDQLDLGRVEAAWNVLIKRHDMLRAVIQVDGTQRILAEVPHYRFRTLDLRGRDATAELDQLRRSLPQRVAEPDAWPLFDIRVTLFDGKARLHMGFDLIALDAASIHALRREWGLMYDHPATVLPAVPLSFRDVVMEQIAHRESEAWKRSERYWKERALALPPGPDLPLAPDATARTGQRFRRLGTIVPAEGAQALRRQAQARGLTLSTLLAAVYADVLARWSRNQHFCITVTSFNRPDLHPAMAQVLGDYTSTILLEVDARADRFAERAAKLARQLADDVEHGEYSSIQVMREIARQTASAPAYAGVVFTSALGFRRASAGPESESGGWDRLGTTVYNVSSTPQVLIDNQISEEDGQLLCNWDVAEDLFAPGVAESMFAAYESLLKALAAGTGWDEGARLLAPALPRAPLLPAAAPDLLHAAFEAQARRTPERVALIAPDAELSYRLLDAAAGHLAAGIAARLGDQRRDRLVAIVLPKGWRQIVAVLAVLKTGAAYLPIDPALPEERRRLLIERSDAIVLDDDGVVDAALAAAKAGAVPSALPPVTDPSRLSYVIYTSGSTGEPKGVMIEHRMAVTTVAEINRRWSVGPDDRVFGLSSLSFDLSVYDIFGALGVGGALVLPPTEANRDPSQWSELLSGHGVTIWNSVPALMAMQAEYGLPADHRLRLVMMSGDWVPVELVKALREHPHLEIVALGGATEAAIWSNAHEVGTVEVAALDPAWTSIPYGTPLAGQMLHVVNGRGEECPDWVIGEIEISGAGVARGYWRDGKQTAERFRTDPHTGERRYRTGDLGRFRPYGEGGPTPIEFLGREDFQVKVQGYRIELGEIESALADHPDVQQAVVTAPFAANKRDRSLHGFVVPRAGIGAGSTPAGGTWDTLVEAGQAALAAHAKAISRDDFEITAGTFGDQAAAAAAQALYRLTGSYELPDADALIRDHGVAPRYRLWLERMLPEVARVGMGAEPASSHALAEIDHFGFGPAALDFLDKVIASLPDLLTERQHSSSIYLDAKTPDVYARLFATPNAVIGTLIAKLAEARSLSILEVGGGLGTTLSAIEPALAADRIAYHFTDVNQHFLRAAAAKFPGRPWLSFSLFDLDAPVPAEHAGRHDVIVASSAVHVAKDVAQALATLRACLKPGGVLILLEETRFLPWFDLGMGLQSGFDTRTDLALRPLHPLLARSGWTRALLAAGFGSAQALVAPGSIEDLIGFDVLVAQAGEDVSANARDDAGLQETLRAWLAERLPAYMVPTTISTVDRIPLSANGKVDRRALVPPAAPRDAETTAASDRLTQEIAELVAGMLKLPTVDPNRSLFELGATSLTLVSLQRLIANRLGRTIGLQQIFERPTVAGFAAEIASRRSVTTPLITFGARRADDERPKLVLMPAIFSLPFYLREMAEMMADQVDIVSVQLPGLAENEQAIDSIPAQADYVVERMRLGGLRAPFMVGGHSFGGRVAIEVARRLRLAGEDVPLLLLGDTVRTFADYGALQTDAMAYTAMARGLYELYGRLTKVPYEALAHLEPEARFRETARHMQEEGLFGVLDLPLDRMLAAFKANFRAIGGYRPAPIPGDMAVIRTEGKYPPEFLDFETADALNDPTLGWGSLVQGKVDARSMPGDHMAMLNPVNLTVMARIMVDLVRQSLAGHLALRHGVTLDAGATPIELAREIRRQQTAS
jgi:amino acid adenylation domain-containing protein